MRPLLLPILLPTLVLGLACRSKLERTKAEGMIRKHYPVVVPVPVPDRAAADQGSPAHQRLMALKENLEKSGWFEIAMETEGSRETFTFRRKSDAPPSVKTSPKGFSLPAAEATFVRAVRMEPTRDGARVTYEIRLDKPTAQFPLFQALHPDAKLGQTKQRQATFERRRGSWALTGTDEAFHKAE